MKCTWLRKFQNFEHVSSNFSSKPIRGSFEVLPKVTNAWFPCKCAMDSRKDQFSCCICLSAIKTSFMDETIFFLEMDMAKQICKSKL